MKRKELAIYPYVYLSTSNNFADENEEEKDFAFLNQALFF